MLQLTQSTISMPSAAYQPLLSASTKSNHQPSPLQASTLFVGGKFGVKPFQSAQISLLYVKKGLPVARLKARTRHLMSEGQMLFLAPNTPVQLDSQTRNTTEVYVLELSVNALQDFLRAQEAVNKGLFLTIKTGEVISDMVIKADTSLAQACQELPLLPTQLQSKDLDALFSRLFTGRTRFFLMGLYQKQTGALALEYISKFIQDNINTNFSIDVLAGMACMSKPHFFRRFKQVFGISPVCFIHQEKIAAAKKLLMQNHSVNEIAHSLGFGSTNYFIRVFKQLENKTPMAFKSFEQKVNLA
jgi:AraC-like DNA-binding protein